jgi:hypothetical protein
MDIGLAGRWGRAEEPRSGAAEVRNVRNQPLDHGPFRGRRAIKPLMDNIAADRYRAGERAVMSFGR